MQSGPDFSAPFELGAFRVEPLSHQVIGPEGQSKLEPRVMGVLLYLAAHEGEVVTRQALLDQVWSDVNVGEEVLNNAVSKLRRTFGDDAKSPRWIETIPKVGYRLLVAPRFQETPPTPNIAFKPKPKPKPLVDRPPLRLLMIGGAFVLFLMASVWWRRPDQQPEPVVTDQNPIHTAPTPVTTLPGPEYNPCLSKDGNRVLFSWAGSKSENWDIYLQQVNGEAPLRLTTDPGSDHSPVWSEDESRVIFQRLGPEGGIYSVPAIGGVERKVLSGINSIYGDVAGSTDGKLLAYNSRLDNNQRFAIFLFDRETTIQRKVTRPGNEIWGDHDPEFSPDGKQIVFVRSQSEGIQDLYLLTLKNDDVRRLTYDARNINGVDWTPDGHIIFASNRGGVMALYRLDPESGSITPLTHLGWNLAKPDISVSGKLAFQHAWVDTDLISNSLQDDEPDAFFAVSTRWDMHPAFSHDGSQVAFTSNRGGTYEVWLCDAQGENTRRLTHFDGPFTGTASWSPDDKHLAFDSRPDGNADLFMINADGDGLHRLTETLEDELAPTFSPDGRQLFYSKPSQGQWQIFSLDLADGEHRPFTQNGGYGGKPGPEGRFLYYAKFNQRGIWRARLDQPDQEEKWVEDLAPEDWASWDFWGESLVYPVRKDGKVWLHQRKTNGETIPIRELKTLPTRDRALSIHGDRILHGKQKTAESDIWLGTL